MATFVLIHGAGDVGWYWHLVEAELRALGHDTVAPDLPCDDDAAGLDEYADAVIAAIGDRRDLVIVGQSLGGFVAPLVVQRMTESAVERTVTKRTVERAAEPGVERAAEGAAGRAAEPATERTAARATEQTAGPAAEQAAEPATEQAVEQIAQGAAGSAVEETMQRAAGSAVEETMQRAAGSAVEETTQRAAGSAVERAGTDRPVKMMVLVAPMIPAPGEAPADYWANTRYAPEGHYDDEIALFYQDVEPNLAAEAVKRGRRQSEVRLREASPLAGWPRVRTKVLIGRDDRLMPVAFQRRVARERLGIIPDEIEGGHTPALSRPGELAARLHDYAA